MIADDAWVPVAEVARPHGVQGELRLRLFNQDSDVLLSIDEVLVQLPDGTEHEVSVDKARQADSAILIKLHSVDDRNRAEELRGAKICVRRADFAPLEEGEFYCCDVVGSEVLYREGDAEPRLLGTLSEVCSYPSVDTFLVKRAVGEGSFEIPLVAAYIERVEVATHKVYVASLEGLELLPPVKRVPEVVPAAPSEDVASPEGVPAGELP